MARALNRLTVRQVAALKETGRHADGGGLYLRITPAGGRSWVFMTATGGKRAEIGLGAEGSVSLATARRIASEMREAVAIGRDPRLVIAVEEPAPTAELLTFGAFAESYIASVEAGWKNPVHRQQWRSSLRDHAASFSAKPIRDIGTDDVLAALQPIWMSKQETASRVRGRIEKILAAAKARGLRPVDAANPAQWRGHLDVLLPKQGKLTRGHHSALPWREAPGFMVELRKREAPVARALEFTILTAARSGETLGATWDEVDLDNELWVVPATRMKAGVEHVVPLSGRAIELLEPLRPDRPALDTKVFNVRGVARSNMAMAMLLRRMGRSDITTHGFRSTFRDWAGDATDFPRELIEQALAHAIGDKSERAYRRGTAIERRRGLMERWARYLGNIDEHPQDGPSLQVEPRSATTG